MIILDIIEVINIELLEVIELILIIYKNKGGRLRYYNRSGLNFKELEYLALVITLTGLYISITPCLLPDIWRYLPKYYWWRKELLC